MISLTKKQAGRLISHSKSESPKEACGIIAGKDQKAEKIYRMTNKDDSAKTFFMEPAEQLKVFKEIRNAGFEMIGIYHSHSQTEAYPSQHDVDMAFYPQVSYVIVSIKDKDNPHIKSFKIKDKKITEEEVRIA